MKADITAKPGRKSNHPLVAIITGDYSHSSHSGLIQQP